MSAEETRSEHVMIRLKPVEKALLDAKAKERGMKPTQLAYEALLGALTVKYTPEEMAIMLNNHATEIEHIYKIIDRLDRRIDDVHENP